MVELAWVVGLVKPPKGTREAAVVEHGRCDSGSFTDRYSQIVHEVAGEIFSGVGAGEAVFTDSQREALGQAAVLEVGARGELREIEGYGAGVPLAVRGSEP